MTIELICAGCGHELSLGQELAGKKVRCPGCKAVLRVPGGEPQAAAAAPRSRGGGGARREDSQGEGEQEGGRRARYRRKHGPPAGLIITVVCLLLAAAAYPLLSSQRQKSIVKQAEADYQLASSRLSAGQAEKARNILLSTLVRLEGAADVPGEVLFRHRTLYAEALIEVHARDEAASQLSLASTLANTSTDKAKLTHLRARAHPNQQEFRVVGEYFVTSLEAATNRDVAREAMDYFHRLLEAKAAGVEARRREVGKYREDAESSANETIAMASARRLPERQAVLDEEVADFENAMRGALQVVGAAAKADEGLARNYEGMFLLARERALGKNQ